MVVLNESGDNTYAGKELPSHKLKFTITGRYIVKRVVGDAQVRCRSQI